jgi:hypothetical protein
MSFRHVTGTRISNVFITLAILYILCMLDLSSFKTSLIVSIENGLDPDEWVNFGPVIALSVVKHDLIEQEYCFSFLEI